MLRPVSFSVCAVGRKPWNFERPPGKPDRSCGRVCARLFHSAADHIEGLAKLAYDVLRRHADAIQGKLNVFQPK